MSAPTPLCLDVGPLTLAVHLPPGRLLTDLAVIWGEFASRRRPDFEVHVRFDPALPERVVSPPPPLAERRGRTLTLRGDNFLLDADLRRRRAQLTMAAAQAPLETACAHLCAALLEGEALLLHASAVALDGGAAVIFGASGAGKTTLAQAASPRCHVFADDLVLVRRGGGGRWAAFGTPFGRGRNDGADLRLLAAPRRGKGASLTPMTPTQGLRELVGNVLLPGDGGRAIEALFSTLAKLCREVDVATLAFAPGVEAATLVASVLAAAPQKCASA